MCLLYRPTDWQECTEFYILPEKIILSYHILSDFLMCELRTVKNFGKHDWMTREKTKVWWVGDWGCSLANKNE